MIFSAIVLSFVAATGFSHWRLLAIDGASMDIADNATPSIERLAAARGEMRRLQILLGTYLERSALDPSADERAITDARHAMDGALRDYLSLPVFPGEQGLWGGILRAKGSLDEAVERCLSEAKRGNIPASRATLRDDVTPAAESLGAAITRDTEFNASHAHDLALQIRTRRGGSMVAAFALDGVCVVVAIIGAIALHRAVRAHDALAARHQRVLEERASELEQFAGRVAHDILSPLNGAGLALELVGRPCDDAQRAGFIARGTRSIERVRRLVGGLLEFARAGAKPVAGARSDVAATMGELVGDLQSAAIEAGAELRVDVDAATSPVACNVGVLTSLVANLARNAIKYIGDGAAQRIDIRAFDQGDFVRFEVRDTGPGLPPGLEENVFDPYVRGPRPSQAGFGLGLATVKRLAEGHGGTVGVHSIPGEGCTFWFELPKAAS
jgi:signal transduction histidine kinase